MGSARGGPPAEVEAIGGGDECANALGVGDGSCWGRSSIPVSGRGSDGWSRGARDDGRGSGSEGCPLARVFRACGRSRRTKGCIHAHRLVSRLSTLAIRALSHLALTDLLTEENGDAPRRAGFGAPRAHASLDQSSSLEPGRARIQTADLHRRPSTPCSGPTQPCPSSCSPGRRRSRSR